MSSSTHGRCAQGGRSDDAGIAERSWRPRRSTFAVALALILWVSPSALAIPAGQPEAENNDTTGTADTLDPSQGCYAVGSGAISPAGDDDYWRIPPSPPAGGLIWALARSSGATNSDTLLTLRDSTDAQLVQDDDSGTGDGNERSSSIAGFPGSASFNRYLVVDGFNNGAVTSYKLFLANTTAAPVPEQEPNNNSASANAIQGCKVPADGAINAAGDVDFYSIGLVAGETLFLSGDGDPENDGTGTDVKLTLFDPSGTQLAALNSGGGGTGASEGGAVDVATTGIHTVQVAHATPTGTPGTYRLLVGGSNTLPAQTNSGTPGAGNQPGPSADNTAPNASRLSMGRAFPAANSGASIAQTRRRRTGTNVSYRLSEAAKVRFTVERRGIGRRVGRRCVKQTRSNRARRRCKLYTRVKGSFSDNGERGSNGFRFTGRMNRRKLRVGSYRLVAVPTDAAGNRGKAVRTGFRIIR